jgi:hypothetical protein
VNAALRITITFGQSGPLTPGDSSLFQRQKNPS